MEFGYYKLVTPTLLKGHSAAVRDLAITPDGSLLVSGSEDETIRLWSLPDGKYLRNLTDLKINYKHVEGTAYEGKDIYGPYRLLHTALRFSYSAWGGLHVQLCPWCDDNSQKIILKSMTLAVIARATLFAPVTRFAPAKQWAVAEAVAILFHTGIPIDGCILYSFQRTIYHLSSVEASGIHRQPGLGGLSEGREMVPRTLGSCSRRT